MFCKIKINKGCILSALFLTLLILSLFSCIGDDYDVAMEESASYSQLKLSFVIPNAVVATRAEEGYEDGIGYENQIDITNHDFRIYFFSYSDNDTNGGTLLAQFTPTRTTSSSSSDETLYTVTGVVPDELLEVDCFRVVVLANWDNSYPDVVEGTTTIDGLTEGEYTTFLAEDKFSLDADNLIPFYGVQEFKDVKIEEGSTTNLDKPISLLRALAKIEIILNDDDDELSFSEVTLHNYNSTGYSAPKGIYLANQYHTGVWANDYVQSLHLYNNGANDDDATQNSINFIKIQDRVVIDGEVTQYETWELYIPEFNNMDDDFSYITTVLKGNSLTNTIFFAMYDEDGTTKAYDSGASDAEKAKRIDIQRNNLYRFYVGFYSSIRVSVQNWNPLDEEVLKFYGM